MGVFNEKHHEKQRIDYHSYANYNRVNTNNNIMISNIFVFIQTVMTNERRPSHIIIFNSNHNTTS